MNPVTCSFHVCTQCCKRSQWFRYKIVIYLPTLRNGYVTPPAFLLPTLKFWTTRIMQYGPCIIWGIDRGFWSKAIGKCLASVHQPGHMCGDPSVPVHTWATYSQCSVLQGEPSSGSAQHLSLMVSASLTTGHQNPSPKACISSGSSIGFLTYVPTKHHGFLLCFSFLKTSLSLSPSLCSFKYFYL